MIAAAVFLACLLVARKWLTIGTTPPGTDQPSTKRKIRESLARALTVAHVGTTRDANPSCRTAVQTARLLWQTWRENWLLLLGTAGRRSPAHRRRGSRDRFNGNA